MKHKQALSQIDMVSGKLGTYKPHVWISFDSHKYCPKKIQNSKLTGALQFINNGCLKKKRLGVFCEINEFISSKKITHPAMFTDYPTGMCHRFSYSNYGENIYHTQCLSHSCPSNIPYLKGKGIIMIKLSYTCATLLRIPTNRFGHIEQWPY